MDFFRPSLSDKLFLELVATVHTLTGITIRPNRKTMLEGRLSKRLRELKLENFESYLKYLSDNANEQESLVNAVTTNETYFYRTPRIWEYISETFLSEWYETNKGKTFSVWSAASSTGEEAHTLGIVLQAFKDKHAGFKYVIKGTDIDTKVIKTASNGLYNGRSIQRFREQKPELFERYMEGNDTAGYSVKPNIKSNISFKEFNLFKPGSVDTMYSLILIRNVLIYFTKEDQAKVIQMIEKRLSTNGVVIIGESETLSSISTAFTSITPTIYTRNVCKDAAKVA